MFAPEDPAELEEARRALEVSKMEAELARKQKKAAEAKLQQREARVALLEAEADARAKDADNEEKIDQLQTDIADLTQQVAAGALDADQLLKTVEAMKAAKKTEEARERTTQERDAEIVRLKFVCEHQEAAYTKYTAKAKAIEAKLKTKVRELKTQLKKVENENVGLRYEEHQQNRSLVRQIEGAIKMQEQREQRILDGKATLGSLLQRDIVQARRTKLEEPYVIPNCTYKGSGLVDVSAFIKYMKAQKVLSGSVRTDLMRDLGDGGLGIIMVKKDPGTELAKALRDADVNVGRICVCFSGFLWHVEKYVMEKSIHTKAGRKRALDARIAQGVKVCSVEELNAMAKFKK